MKTIVIVDDELGLADVLHATLADAGYRVFTASNGMQGLLLMTEHLPDVVVLDFMMPLLDGPGTLRAMQGDARLFGVPVVMMSSMPEASVQARCGGYAAYLRKPFQFEALIAAIVRLTGAPVPCDVP